MLISVIRQNEIPDLVQQGPNASDVSLDYPKLIVQLSADCCELRREVSSVAGWSPLKATEQKLPVPIGMLGSLDVVLCSSDCSKDCGSPVVCRTHTGIALVPLKPFGVEHGDGDKQIQQVCFAHKEWPHQCHPSV
jgi:hypothetical protein